MNINYLFNDGDVFAFQRALNRNVADHINALPAHEIRSKEVEILSQECEKKFFIDVPVLRTEQEKHETKEKDIDVTHDHTRMWSTPGPHYVKGTEVSYTIPFSGNASLFRIRPSNFSLNIPTGEINGQTLVLRIQGTNLIADNVRKEYETRLRSIEGYLATLRSDMATFNSGILAAARQQLEGRRKKILRDDDLNSKLSRY